MREDKPYFLARMDEWHYQRLERRLNPEVEENIAKLILNVAAENPVNEARTEAFSDAEVKECVDSVKESYIDFFTMIYRDIEQILTGKNNDGFFEAISETSESHIIDLMESCKRVLSFPSRVMERARQFEPITDEELNLMFLQAYKTPRSFTDIYLRYRDSKFEVCVYLLKANLLKLDSLEEIEVQTQLAKKITPFLNPLIFSDLDNPIETN